VRATFHTSVCWCVPVSSCRRSCSCVSGLPLSAFPLARCLCARRSLHKNHPRSQCSRSRRHWPWAVCVLFPARGCPCLGQAAASLWGWVWARAAKVLRLTSIYAHAIIPSIPYLSHFLPCVDF
jgi:hypothetical protein